jgi:phosphoribosylformylglycinamidine synthase PurS subunit
VAIAVRCRWLSPIPLPAFRPRGASGKTPVKATVIVMLKHGVLDPQGKAIGQALHSLGFDGVGEVRAGKVIELELAGSDPAQGRAQAEDMARRLLANSVIESFRVEIA